MKKSIFCVIGARPQFIKHSILSRSLEKHFEVTTVNTYQHYNDHLNSLLFSDLELKPADYNLITKPGEVASRRLTRLFSEISNLISDLKPRALLVYGDTDSTLAGALAANRNSIPLIHIEAGERSFNQDMPEEVNRILTDSLSEIMFCSSQQAVDNLALEGKPGKVIYSGDLLKDLLIETESSLSTPPLDSPYYFASIHRKYTRDSIAKLNDILSELNRLSFPVIFSLHPSTEHAIQNANMDLAGFGNIRFVNALTYKQSICHQKFASAVLTDSGGMQKEAYWLKTPCITLRPETEWTQTLNGNWNQLVYENLNLSGALNNSTGEHNPLLYGDGNAGQLITEALKQYF